MIETRTERRTVITRDGDNIDHDKVTRFLLFNLCLNWSKISQISFRCQKMGLGKARDTIRPPIEIHFSEFDSAFCSFKYNPI